MSGQTGTGDEIVLIGLLAFVLNQPCECAYPTCDPPQNYTINSNHSIIEAHNATTLSTTRTTLDIRSDPTLADDCWEGRNYSQAGLSPRIAIGGDGVVYAAFHRYTAPPPDGGGPRDLEIVVLRDDDYGFGDGLNPPFTQLYDPQPPSGDGLLGYRVRRDKEVRSGQHMPPGSANAERISNSLAIAVDPFLYCRSSLELP
ncbi:MAG: hypothetical protein ACF8LL_04075 [Phycisphaerales bacterium]